MISVNELIIRDYCDQQLEISNIVIDRTVGRHRRVIYEDGLMEVSTS